MVVAQVAAPVALVGLGGATAEMEEEVTVAAAAEEATAVEEATDMARSTCTTRMHCCRACNCGSQH